ncbi:MAG: cyclodeaminase/cyclohydrolase family protein [Peptococcaceae bacterium]|jgi:formiminotetrahydrofolate cyclodeaminase|nr:cyclodeaminase/cyclohydrolase family protein [Peptococcaceae bacterium]
MLEKSCQEFLAALASAEPVPGGGGASAYAGALGVALGSMVANLTVGKKKYAAAQEDIQALLPKADTLRQELAGLVEKDAAVFAPLARAYGLPKETAAEKELRAQVMEQALSAAALVPLEIMERALDGLSLQAELAEKGSQMAISDVGVGTQLLKAAILGASMNVFINTKLMADRRLAAEMAKKADDLIAAGSALADKIYRQVEARLR